MAVVYAPPGCRRGPRYSNRSRRRHHVSFASRAKTGASELLVCLAMLLAAGVDAFSLPGLKPCDCRAGGIHRLTHTL
jgi:hypothetical protein